MLTCIYLTRRTIPRANEWLLLRAVAALKSPTRCCCVNCMTRNGEEGGFAVLSFGLSTVFHVSICETCRSDIMSFRRQAKCGWDSTSLKQFSRVGALLVNRNAKNPPDEGPIDFFWSTASAGCVDLIGWLVSCFPLVAQKHKTEHARFKTFALLPPWFLLFPHALASGTQVIGAGSAAWHCDFDTPSYNSLFSSFILLSSGAHRVSLNCILLGR